MDKYVTGLSPQVMNTVFRNYKLGVKKTGGERWELEDFCLDH